jgi:integrase
MTLYYIPRKNFQVLTEENLKPYLDLARYEMKPLLALAFITGARIGELVQLRKKDFIILPERNEFNILIPTLKRRDTETFIRELGFDIQNDSFIASIIIPYVNSLQSQEQLLFPLTKRSYEFKLKKLNEEIWGSEKEGKLHWITWHYFRHSVLTYLGRNLRATSYEIQQWTGHESIESQKDYLIHSTANRFRGRMKR